MKSFRFSAALRRAAGILPGLALATALLGWCLAPPGALRAQVESVGGGAPSEPVWASRFRLEGHLALDYSPAGAFSPKSATLAVPSSHGKIALVSLADGRIERVLQPHLENITDLDVESASFLDSDQLFILGRGLVKIKDKGVPPRTPRLAFRWSVSGDAMVSKLDGVGQGEGYGEPRYFPRRGYLGIFHQQALELWSPISRRGGEIPLSGITQQPRLFAVSPDGNWLLLAQIPTASSPNPVVYDIRQHKLADVLLGHHGAVLSIGFSPDGRAVATACEDGNVRVFSVPDWKLLHTLPGADSPVHWVEFSPDGQWIASAGEDTTVRIWSAADGKLVQTLRESRAPLRTVAFSPDGRYLAASSEEAVLVWQRG